MKKLFAGIVRWLARKLDEEQSALYQPKPEIEQESTLDVESKQEVILPQLEIEQESISKQEAEETIQIVELKKQDEKEVKKKKNSRRKKPREGEVVTITIDPINIRDVMELMEVPIVSLSKNRKTPINYENGSVKVKISCHTEHYIASIYDWDIILFVSSKLQETINSKSDIPPRTLIISRHELLRSIHRYDGKKQEKDLKASLSRLNTTLIETTVSNEDGRYEGGFGFLDSWGYTDRKDIKEFRITLSQWLYDITCRNGSLLKMHPEYFKITSGLKRFLYRTARKHVGTRNESWPFLVETLYKKSGSEQIFKCFKRDLKKAVNDNDIPDYLMEWVEEDGKTLVRFMNLKKVEKKEDITPPDVTAKKSKPSSNPTHSEHKRIVSDLISASIKRIK
jgi:plasmid replication initiation protein